MMHVNTYYGNGRTYCKTHIVIVVGDGRNLFACSGKDAVNGYGPAGKFEFIDCKKCRKWIVKHFSECVDFFGGMPLTQMAKDGYIKGWLKDSLK